MQVKTFGFFWGVGGVVLLLSTAVVRLAPYALELGSVSLTLLQWVLLVAFTLFMAYTEGYRGFYLHFSPRVVRRAACLGSHARPHQLLLAPLLCMGFFHATRSRMIVAWALTGMIIVLVLIIRALPQPWRGIVDTGVVVGLTMGIGSILYFFWQALRDVDNLSVAPEFPAGSPLLNPPLIDP
ncbi:MAG: hypothetical protein PsegKO_07710 [Pseudohongiellaceae bacterium]